MEKALHKMAKQLRALDEASLMNLWERYAQSVASFEPTSAWEEAVIIMGLIQSIRFKNQLFNYHWSGMTDDPDPDARAGPASDKGGERGELRDTRGSGNGPDRESPDASGPGVGPDGSKSGKVLRFPTRKD